MGTVLRDVRPLPDYRMELQFQNGSMAIINMEKRVRTFRFARLAAPDTFVTARASGDKVEWTDGKETFSVFCSELLDIMLLE